jgi:hypothetical protein
VEAPCVPLRALSVGEHEGRAQRAPRRWLFALAGAAALLSCNSPNSVPGTGVPSECQVQAPLVQPAETDILFVVDDSGSMAPVQQLVAKELPAFVAALQLSGGVEHDFRLGLTTTSVYLAFQYFNTVAYQYYPEAGWLRQLPLVDGGPGTERYLDGTNPDVVPRFSLAMVGVGISGSGQETPLEATRIALQNAVAPLELTDGGPANRGFLRDGARLMVVAVTNEDDCSETRRPPLVHYTDSDGQDYCIHQQALLTPVGDYYTLLQNLPDGRGRNRDVLWGALAPVSLVDKSAQAVECGDPDAGFFLCNMDCPTSDAPGYRLREMALLFDLGLGNLYSICAPSYHEQLLALAAIAAIPQTLELNQNVPDPRLLQITLVRGDGTEQVCTVGNQGLVYEAPPDGGFPRVHFEGKCLRQQTDTQVTVRMFCAG